MMKKQILVLVATAILVWDTQVFAEVEQLDTITVTAQKQEENVQDVPMGVTVFSTQDIEDKKIDSLRDIADLVPNFYLNYEGVSGMNAPSMRGIYAPATTLIASAGLFIDGVPVLSPAGFEDLMLDVERVEVLRGPQGTLYGKNTETGAINIITRQPDNEFRGRLSAEAGKLLSVETGDGIKTAFTASLSSPIQKDKLFFGFAGKFYQQDGFIENTLTGDSADDKAHGFGRAHLRWTPTDRLDISLIASMLEYDDDAPNMSFTDTGSAMFGLPSSEYRKVSPDFEGSNKANSNSQSLKIKYDFSDALALTSITARRVYNDEADTDWDFSSSRLMHSNKDNQYTKISQELRLDSSSEKLNWLAGLYYDNDKNEFNVLTESDIPAFASIGDRDFTGDAYAIFGQAGYAFTQKLKLTGGLRYEIQNQEYENYVSGTNTDDSWDEISPRLAVEYRFTPAWMTWVSATKGYRSGGFNTFAADPAYVSYEEEKLWSYEVGSKAAFLNNRLILNACLFYMDITDMQVMDAVSPTDSYLTNAAEATSMGIELEMTARVTDSLTLMAGFGYTDVEFDEFTDALGDYTGNKNPYAPEYTFNIGAQYRHELGFYARVDLVGYGEMFLDKFNRYSREAFQIVNAKIGYETDHFDIYLYGKNIFDEEYDSVGYYDGYYTVYSDPGEVGLQLTYRF